jgi:hypothetical protein
MAASNDMITVRVNVDIPTDALKTIVATAKQIVGPDEKGHFRVDTADKVGEMISRFLLENDFEQYVDNPQNYSR